MPSTVRDALDDPISAIQGSLERLNFANNVDVEEVDGGSLDGSCDEVEEGVVDDVDLDDMLEIV